MAQVWFLTLQKVLDVLPNRVQAVCKSLIICGLLELLLLALVWGSLVVVVAVGPVVLLALLVLLKLPTLLA